MSDELAKEIAEALTPPAKKPSAKMAKSTAAYIYSKRAAERSAEISRIREIVLPILRPHIERHERLREAAKRVCFAHELKPSMDNRELENKHIRLTHADSIAALRTALDEETKG